MGAGRGVLKAGLARLLGHPQVSKATLALLEGVGADALAARVDRLRPRDGLEEITLPPGPDPVSPPSFRMHGLAGRDMVVRSIRDGGWGGFEAPLPSVVVALVRARPTTVLDVGANTGLYSLIAVTAHLEARAVAYEPVPPIGALLAANVAANAQGARVVVRSCAITDRTGPVQLHLPPPQLDGTVESSASVESDFKEIVEQVVTVEGVTLDDAWAAEGRPQVDLVKIDVEGAEHRVLAGSGELVRTCRPLLTVEVLPTKSHLDAIEAFRGHHRYVDVILTPTAAVLNRSRLAPDARAPNHLLVPEERIDETVQTLCSVPELEVTRP